MSQTAVCSVDGLHCNTVPTSGSTPGEQQVTGHACRKERSNDLRGPGEHNGINLSPYGRRQNAIYCAGRSGHGDSIEINHLLTVCI